MAIRIANNALENCHSIKQVVELINNQSATDASAEMVAAAYAWNAAEESGYTDNDSIEANLDFLRDSGAEFDFSEALEMAINEKKS